MEPAGTGVTAPAPAPGTRAPAGPGGRLRGHGLLHRAGRSPAMRQAVLLAVFLGAGVAVTWPLATYLPARLPSSRDSAAYVWSLWWVARQLTHLGNPWLTPLMAAPAGVQLGFSSLLPLPGLLLAPVTWAYGPATAYDLLVLAVPGLLCYAMYRAARLWLPGVGAVTAGALFGLSAMLTQQDWYHLNIALGAFFLPVTLEASVRLRRQPGTRQAVALGLVMAAAMLTDQESALLAAIVAVLTLAPWLAGRPRWQRLRVAALAAGAGVLAASPQFAAMFQEVRVGGLAIPPHILAVSYKQYGIGLSVLFSPTPRVSDFGLGALAGPFLHGRDNEGMPMFGTVLTVLALAGLAVSRRRRSAWLLAGLWAGCAALALGTSLWLGKHQYLPLAQFWHGVRVSDLMPYTWFVRVPGLSGFREADRLAILGLMPAALLAGAAVSWLRSRSRLLLVPVAALAVLEAGYGGSPKIAAMPARFPGVDRLIAADRSHSIVVDFPFGLRGGIPVYGVPFFPKALVMATEDGHPRAISYTSRVPLPTIRAMAAHPFYRDLVTVQHETRPVCPLLPQGCLDRAGVRSPGAGRLSPAQLAQARADACSMHIGWVVVWKRNPSVRAFLLPYIRGTGFHFDYRAGNVLVYSRHRKR